MKYLIIFGIVVVVSIVILAIVGYFKEREDRKLYEKYTGKQEYTEPLGDDDTDLPF